MGNYIRRIDWQIVIPLLLLSIFGLSVLLTVDTSLFYQQGFFVLVGIGLFILCSLLDPIILRWSAPLVYVFSCIFLSLSYLGPNIRGATRWLMLGNTQIQPSELVKPFLLLAFSSFLMRFPPRNLKNILIQTVLFLIPFALVFRQPDLGSSIVYFCMWISMLFAYGMPFWILIIGAVLTAISSPLMWMFLAPYQKMRILTFLDPMHDPGGVGYNAMQSMIAVGSGSFFGRGLGLGTQSHLSFLPEFHTDFIFATLIEELGFLGGVLLLGLYALLLWRLIQPFFKSRIDDHFAYIYSIGLLSMLLSQIAINSGMNMGIIPITGITLPLISYGGSSLLSIMTSFGLLMALRERKQPESSLQSYS